MRNELIYFLQHANDEKIIISLIKNMDANSLVTLLNHLQFTDEVTEQRWLKSIRSAL